MAKIEIIQLGDIYPVDLNKIKRFGDKSSIFEITTISESNNPEILNKEVFSLNDSDFEYLAERQINSDFAVVLVNRPLECNYLSRLISEKLIVVSIFNIESLNIIEGITAEMYLTRFILAFSTIYHAYDGLKAEASELMQKNASGCLFDFCQYKPQVAIFFRQPKLSIGAINKLEEKPLPQNYLSSLKKEIRSLKIGIYYKLKDWLKANPIKAIILTLILGLLFSELLGNYIYDLVNDYLPIINK